MQRSNVDPLINKPPPLNGDYNKDPNIKALTRRGCINYGPTLPVAFGREGIFVVQPGRRSARACKAPRH